MLLQRLSINRRLQLLVVIAALAAPTVSLLAVRHLGDTVMDSRKAALENVVRTAADVVRELVAAAETRELTKDQAQARAKQLLRAVRYTEAGDYLFIYDSAGTAVMHGRDPEKEGANRIDATDAAGFPLIRGIIEAGIGGEGFVRYVHQRDGVHVPKLSYATYIPAWDWVLATGVYIDDVDAAVAAEARRLGLVVAGVTVVLLAIAILISRSIAGPVHRLRHALAALAEGRHDIAVSDTGAGGDIGQLAGTVADLRAQVARKAALESERRELMERLAGRVEREVRALVADLGAAVGDTRRCAHELGSIADDAGGRADDVGKASAAAGENSRVVAESVSEVATSTQEIAAQLGRTTASVRRAVAASDEATRFVGTLETATGEIATVAALIAEIAGQTNMLALNATIEAARAGTAGQGFAVVAGEVKSLAAQTASATEEIQRRVRAIEEATRGTGTATRTIDGVIREVEANAVTISGAVEEQNVATAAISDSVATAASEVERIARDIHALEDAAGGVGGAAQALERLAGDLATKSDGLDAAVGALLEELRAA